MRKTEITDEQVQEEIERLTEDDFVKIARLEQRIRYKSRQKLYALRNLQKRGKELAEAGLTYDVLKVIYDQT